MAAKSRAKVTVRRASAQRATAARPRPVRVPADLARALRASRAAKAQFDAWPPSHRRQLMRYVTDAKRAETRARRIEAMVERLAKDWRLSRG